MRARLVVLAVLLLPLAARAQTQGWGDMGKQEDQGFSWTEPLFGGFWMAWTPATLAFFTFIFASIALMGLLEWRNPGGAPRHGVLGMDTTRGDRLFIGLLGSAYVFIAWIGIVGLTLWWPLAIAVAWIAFVFWKV
jgi:predicted small integral membrane protein